MASSSEDSDTQCATNRPPSPSGSESSSSESSLSEQELEDCLDILECKTKDGLPTGKMLTSHFTRSKLLSTAAYKLLKVKRWQLLDEGYIFDPQLLQENFIQIKKKNVLWCEPFDPNSKLDCQETDLTKEINDDHLFVQELFVDGILSRYSDEKLNNLRKLEEAMAFLDIRGKINVGGVTIGCIEDELFKGLENLPVIMQESYTEFVVTMTGIICMGFRQKKVEEADYQDCFSHLFKCVAQAVGENFNFKCKQKVFGMDSKDVAVAFQSKSSERTVLLTSKPDLVIIKTLTEKRCLEPVTVIAVLEAKGKKGNEIIHSDDEELPEVTMQRRTRKARRHSLTCSHTIKEEKDQKRQEDDDEDYADYKDKKKRTNTCKKRNTDEDHDLPKDAKHSKIRRIPSSSKRILRKFLPQLIGEMLMYNTIPDKNILPVNTNCPGYSLGIGLVGFDVYFVTMIGKDRHKSFAEGLRSEGDYNNVFITRPLSILTREDRRIILKILAAMYDVHRHIL